MKADLFLRPLFDWRAAVASQYGPANPTTRHVLLTLSLHMSVKGDSCFPSGALLAAETALTRRAIVVNLAVAAEAGWLGKRERPEKTGKGWRRIEYFALIPPGVEKAMKAAIHDGGEPGSPPNGGEPGSPPSDMVVILATHGGEPGSHELEVLEDVKRKVSGQGKPSPVSACWQVYQQGIKAAYGAEYPPSAQANGQLNNVVKKLGSGPAIQVVAHYLANKKPYYVARKHALEVLVRDCATLWLECQQVAGGRAAQPCAYCPTAAIGSVNGIDHCRAHQNDAMDAKRVAA